MDVLDAVRHFGWFSPTAVVFVPAAPLAPGTTYFWSYGGDSYPSSGVREAGGGRLLGFNEATFTTAR